MVEINNYLKAKVNLKFIQTAAEKFLEHYKEEQKGVSIALVGDKEIKKLNKQYRRHDAITDVLAFPGEADFLGEIIIDFSQIKRQAKVFRQNVKDELMLVLVHGLLHLLGYDDRTKRDKLRMERISYKFIKSEIENQKV